MNYWIGLIQVSCSHCIELCYVCVMFMLLERVYKGTYGVRVGYESGERTGEVVSMQLFRRLPSKPLHSKTILSHVYSLIIHYHHHRQEIH